MLRFGGEPMKAVRRDEEFKIRFTVEERDLILEVALVDGAVAELLRRATDVERGEIAVSCSADVLDDFLGAIAAAANHCDESRLRSRLDRLHDRLEKLERTLLVLDE
jgi:hypothetical protein